MRDIELHSILPFFILFFSCCCCCLILSRHCVIARLFLWREDLHSRHDDVRRAFTSFLLSVVETDCIVKLHADISLMPSDNCLANNSLGHYGLISSCQSHAYYHLPHNLWMSLSSHFSNHSLICINCREVARHWLHSYTQTTNKNAHTQTQRIKSQKFKDLNFSSPDQSHFLVVVILHAVALSLPNNINNALPVPLTMVFCQNAFF